jgi:hypothetical protein
MPISQCCFKKVLQLISTKQIQRAEQGGKNEEAKERKLKHGSLRFPTFPPSTSSFPPLWPLNQILLVPHFFSWAGWPGSNTLNLHWGDVCFKSQMWNWLSYQVFVVFLSLTRQIPHNQTMTASIQIICNPSFINQPTHHSMLHSLGTDCIIK